MTRAHISECNLPAEHTGDCGIAYGPVAVRMLDGTERKVMGHHSTISPNDTAAIDNLSTQRGPVTFGAGLDCR